MSEPIGECLRHYLINTYYNEPAEARRISHWVMNAEWYDECRKLGPSGWPVLEPITLVGLPVEVRDDAGAPVLTTEPVGGQGRDGPIRP